MERKSESSIESTLILVTSNLSNEQVAKIKSMVIESNLQILSEQFIELDRNKIQRLWPTVVNEETQERTYRILSGRKLLLMQISGCEAVSTVLSLKREVREKLVGHDDKFNRIIHCPDSQEEYSKELEIFLAQE